MGLEKLDLSDNVLSSMNEVKRIRKLPLLSQLWLQGNPISYLDIYRKQTLLYFLSEVRSWIYSSIIKLNFCRYLCLMANLSQARNCRGWGSNSQTRQLIWSTFIRVTHIHILTRLP